MVPVRRSTFFATFVMALLGGCAGYPTNEPGLHVQWADDVGTVTVSQSGGVNDWDDIASDLQPNFKMDSDKALAAAIPITQSFDERLYDALTANVQAGLPTATSSQVTKQATDPETGELSTTVENSRTRQSGTTPPAAALSPTGAAALTALASQSLGDDPMLRYLAATALQQEVALLNRYVKGQVQWPGSQAFVARLQLTVMPNARTMPYDIETDITLHSEDEQSRAGLALPSEMPPLLEQGVAGSVGSGAQAIDARAARCAPGSFDTLQVLPMIVTDNLEGMRAARATDNVRQLAFALLGTAGNVGASGQFSRTMEELRRSEGRDTNSLLTVAKLSDDTVRVRLGAVQSPRYGHLMTARNHFVSLVIVMRPCIAKDLQSYVDEGPRTITALTRTTYRDGDTGKVLPYRSGSARLMAQIEHIQKDYVDHFNYLELARMYQWANRQDRKHFFDYVIDKHLRSNMCKRGILSAVYGLTRFYKVDADELTKLSEGGDLEFKPKSNEQQAAAARADPRCLKLALMRYSMVAAPMWTELQSIRPAGQFAFTNIPIRLRKRTPTLPRAQTALVNFSNTEGNVTLSQGQNMTNFSEPEVVLVDDRGETIPAAKAMVAADGKSITASFPALKRFGIKIPEPPTPAAPVPAVQRRKSKSKAPAAAPAPPPPPTYRLVVTAAPRDRTCADQAGAAIKSNDSCTYSYPVRLYDTSPASPTSPFSIDVTSTAIAADPETSTGKLIVSVNAGKNASSNDLRLSIDGAQIARAHLRDGTQLVMDGGSWKLGGVGDVVLDLENLIPNTIVKVSLKDGSTGAGMVSRSVVAGTGKPK